MKGNVDPLPVGEDLLEELDSDSKSRYFCRSSYHLIVIVLSYP